MTLYFLLHAAEEIELSASVSGEAARLQDHVVLAEHLAQSSHCTRNGRKEPMEEGLHVHWRTPGEDVCVLAIGVF